MTMVGKSKVEGQLKNDYSPDEGQSGIMIIKMPLVEKNTMTQILSTAVVAQ
jgi:hypothetical protein